MLCQPAPSHRLTANSSEDQCAERRAALLLLRDLILNGQMTAPCSEKIGPRKRQQSHRYHLRL